MLSAGYEIMPLHNDRVTEDMKSSDSWEVHNSRSQSLAPVSSEVEGGIHEDGRRLSVALTEVEDNNKEWQMVSPISGGGDGGGAGDAGGG